MHGNFPGRAANIHGKRAKSNAYWFRSAHAFEQSACCSCWNEHLAFLEQVSGNAPLQEKHYNSDWKANDVQTQPNKTKAQKSNSGCDQKGKKTGTGISHWTSSRISPLKKFKGCRICASGQPAG